MRIGIMSIHSAHNYGSVLQAYALQEYLIKLSGKNDTVEIIDYRPWYFEKMYKMVSLKIYDDFPGFANKVVHFGWRTLYVFRRYRKYKSFKKYIESKYNLSEKRYRSFEELTTINNKYDVIIVGSDQVWNTDITNGFDRAYYLDFVQAKRTIKASYAASIARESIDEKYIKDYKRCLNDFDYISIREKSGKELLKTLVDKDIEVSTDPTLLLEKKDWDKLAGQSRLNIKDNYIFTYILQDNPEIVELTNHIAQKMNLKVISVGKKKRFKNERVIASASPEDFLYLVKNSSFVITNSFHGTVFSVVFEKKNCIIPHLGRGSRMVDLMAWLGLQKRVIYSMNEYSDDILKEIDYEAVKHKIEQEKNKSKKYLEKVLRNE